MKTLNIVLVVVLVAVLGGALYFGKDLILKQTPSYSPGVTTSPKETPSPEENISPSSEEETPSPSPREEVEEEEEYYSKLNLRVQKAIDKFIASGGKPLTTDDGINVDKVIDNFAIGAIGCPSDVEPETCAGLLPMICKKENNKWQVIIWGVGENGWDCRKLIENKVPPELIEEKTIVSKTNPTPRVYYMCSFYTVFTEEGEIEKETCEGYEKECQKYCKFNTELYPECREGKWDVYCGACDYQAIYKELFKK